jgi:hypothetical protein
MRSVRHSMTGAAMLEALVALPIILVACLLVLQMTLLYRAKIALNYAAQEGARIGSMSNARVVPRFLTDITSFSVTGNGKKAKPVSASAIPGASASSDGERPGGRAFEESSEGSQSRAPAPPEVPKMKLSTGVTKIQGKEFLKSLGKGLLRYGDSSVLQGFITGITPFYVRGTEFTDVVEGQLEAYADAMMNSCILYHNPTQSSFIDFGFLEVEGPDKMVLQIPSDLMRYRVPRDVDPSGKGTHYFESEGAYLDADMKGIRDGVSTMSVQDANLLSIEIRYSAPMKVPIAREIIIGISKLYNNLRSDETALGAAFVDNALEKKRWPMTAYATYRMRSPVHWHIFYPLGDVSYVRSREIEAFDGIQQLWNLVIDGMAPTKEGGQREWDPAEPQIGFCPGLMIDALSKDESPESWVGKDYDEMLAKCVKVGNCP